jgi:hypothetical protein
VIPVALTQARIEKDKRTSYSFKELKTYSASRKRKKPFAKLRKHFPTPNTK